MNSEAVLPASRSVRSEKTTVIGLKPVELNSPTASGLAASPYSAGSMSPETISDCSSAASASIVVPRFETAL